MLTYYIHEGLLHVCYLTGQDKDMVPEAGHNELLREVYSLFNDKYGKITFLFISYARGSPYV